MSKCLTLSSKEFQQKYHVKLKKLSSKSAGIFQKREIIYRPLQGYIPKILSRIKNVPVIDFKKVSDNRSDQNSRLCLLVPIPLNIKFIHNNNWFYRDIECIDSDENFIILVCFRVVNISLKGEHNFVHSLKLVHNIFVLLEVSVKCYDCLQYDFLTDLIKKSGLILYLLNFLESNLLIGLHDSFIDYSFDYPQKYFYIFSVNKNCSMTTCINITLYTLEKRIYIHHKPKLNFHVYCINSNRSHKLVKFLMLCFSFLSVIAFWDIKYASVFDILRMMSLKIRNPQYSITKLDKRLIWGPHIQNMYNVIQWMYEIVEVDLLWFKFGYGRIQTTPRIGMSNASNVSQKSMFKLNDDLLSRKIKKREKFLIVIFPSSLEIIPSFKYQHTTHPMNTITVYVECSKLNNIILLKIVYRNNIAYKFLRHCLSTEACRYIELNIVEISNNKNKKLGIVNVGNKSNYNQSCCNLQEFLYMKPVNLRNREVIVHAQYSKKAYINTNKPICAMYNLKTIRQFNNMSIIFGQWMAIVFHNASIRSLVNVHSLSGLIFQIYHNKNILLFSNTSLTLVFVQRLQLTCPVNIQE
ncbi:hypothetical protein AGLY_012748 [Aphis glycines]|uniref:Uncharacterized protein n=1 Tax=Aphis glycines TaxID=307491 RepID=A0A6G0T810_APHGL|nr:hypothetical protein AGLY_012748 [Aphis glycines]